MTPEIKQAIDLSSKKAAEAAVRRTLLALGIDASTPSGIQQQQQDMAFLRTIRTAANAKSAKYWVGIIAFAVAVVGAVCTVVLNHLFNGGHGP